MKEEEEEEEWKKSPPTITIAHNSDGSRQKLNDTVQCLIMPMYTSIDNGSEK